MCIYSFMRLKWLVVYLYIDYNSLWYTLDKSINILFDIALDDVNNGDTS